MTDKDTAITILICGGLFSALIFFVNVEANNVEKDYQINGIVNEVAFTEKGTPEIMIGGEVYTIRFPRKAFIDKIQVGDSIVKEKSSESYKLIKKNSFQVILSD